MAMSGLFVSVDRCARCPDARCGQGRKHAINDRKERLKSNILSNLQSMDNFFAQQWQAVLAIVVGED
jgi:hypothetical protein